MAVLRSYVLGMVVAAFWMGLVAPAGASLKYEEEYVYPPAAARHGKSNQAPRTRTALSGQIPLDGRDLSRLAADTPWKIRLGQTLLPGGTLADASRFQAGKARGRVVVRLRDGGRLRMEWDRRYLRFSLNLKTSPQFITPPKPPLKPRRAVSVPSQVVGFALGELAVLHDLPLKSRTTRRGVFLRGVQRNDGSPWQALTILSPAHGSSTRALPVHVRLYFDAASDPSKKTVHMNGIDITTNVNPAAQASQGNSSAAAAPMPGTGIHEGWIARPAVSLGKNQVRVTAGPLTASASFFYGVASSLPNGLPLLVPIQTRYLAGDGTHATDYGIALYLDPENPTTPKVYYASGSSTTGFQILYLSRADLSMVSNQTVPNPQPAGPASFWASQLAQALTYPPSGCAIVGCILIVQSLEFIGYTPAYDACLGPPNMCNENNDVNWNEFSSLFQGLGGSSRIAYANGANSQIAYSFIGNAGGQGNAYAPGTFFERLTCSGSNYGTQTPDATWCDKLGYPNTSYTAPANPSSGASPLSGIGKMDGTLIVDNQGLYTYAPNARPVQFSTSTDKTNLKHTISVDGVNYVSDALNGSPGGFHFLLLDRDTLAVREHHTYAAKSDASEVATLHALANTYGSYNNLFIIAAYGDTHYGCSPNSTCQARSNWADGAGLMQALGGTWQVFYVANNPEASPQPKDDYTLVGAWIDLPTPSRPGVTTGLEGQTYAEMSSVIAAVTEKYPLESDMEGILTQDHQGYYSPGPTGHNLGLSSVATSDFLAASLLNPTPWPTAPPGWPTHVDSAKAMAAYAAISNELCCEDIRSAYANLNNSPAIWLAELQALTYDPSVVPNSSPGDFAAIKAQLLTEFQYVQAVRQLQNNLFGMYQTQQANVSLLLTQAYNEVINNIQVDFSTPAHGLDFLGILGDVFAGLSSVSEFLSFVPEVGSDTATILNATFGLASLAFDTAATYTNTAAGSPLQAQEKEEIAVADLADRLADNYADTLSSLGGQFDRTVANWSGLYALGKPLVANEIPWNAKAVGTLLATFDRMTRRELYTQLLKKGASVTLYPWISDDSVPSNSRYSDEALCHWPTLLSQTPPWPLVYFPTGQRNTIQSDFYQDFPHEYQWGAMALTWQDDAGKDCPDNADYFPATDTFGLFRPLDPNDPNTLGAYPLWWFTRSGLDSTTNNSNQDCAGDSSCSGQ